MKTTRIFLCIALSGLMMSPLAQAQSTGYDFTQDDEPAGYDFTDEEAAADAAAAAEKQKKELQALIYNGVQYLSACRKAYQEDVVWPVSACCDGIINNEDFVQCIKGPVPADLHQEAVSKIMGKHPYSAEAGQFAEGVLSRSTLAQAKQNLTPQQYKDIEHMITRAEALMKWFTGTFAKACAVHNYEYLKEVQRVARFKEYLKSDDITEVDIAYSAMVHAFKGNYAALRVDKASSTFHGDPRRYSNEFFRHFHNSISQEERDSWLSFAVLGGSVRGRYNGPTFGMETRFIHRGLYDPYTYFDVRGGKVMHTATAESAKMACYMRHFETWSDNRITAMEDQAFEARSLVRTSADDYFAGVAKSAAEIVVKEDSDFKHAVSNLALYALDRMISMDDEILGLREHLKKNSNFMKNRAHYKTDAGLQRLIQQHVDSANNLLNSLHKAAQRHVPESDASRLTN